MQQHVAKIEGLPPAPTLQVQQVLPQMPQKCSLGSGWLLSLAMHPVGCLRLRLQKLKPQKQRLKHQRHHPRSEAQKAKSPRPATPKAESPTPAVPKAKADTPKAVAKATSEEPAQKKAATTSEPKSVPVAKSPAAPPAAKVMQQTAKVPAQEMPSKPPSVADPAKTTAPKSHGAGSTPKSLGKDTVPKKAAKVPQQQSVPSVRRGIGQCSRCFAQMFKGQIQCDVYGLMLEDASRAQRTKIAERRKEELRKFGVKYDFKVTFSSRSRTSNLKVWVYW